ncbi:hypothetical protein AAC387_Pa01g3023 [Persea americana]
MWRRESEVDQWTAVRGNLPRYSSSIFMSSRRTVASSVSCKLGNFWILVCLLPGFLGAPVVFENFQLLKATVRDPSSLTPVFNAFGEGQL